MIEKCCFKVTLLIKLNPFESFYLQMMRYTFMNSVYVFFTSKLVPDFEYRREVCFFSLLLALYSKFVSRKYGKRVKSSQWACNELKVS